MLLQIQAAEGFASAWFVVSPLSGMAKLGFFLLIGFLGLFEDAEKLFGIFDNHARLVDDSDGLAELAHLDV